MNEQNNYESIPQEKFAFVNDGERIFDKKFDDKPIGYVRDAMNRFAKSKVSVVAGIIIAIMMVLSLVAPLAIRTHNSTFLVTTYAKMAPRVAALANAGIDTGYTNKTLSEKLFIKYLGIGVAAADTEATGMSVGESMDSDYQPILKIKSSSTSLGADKKETTTYNVRLEDYLAVGFLYKTIEQSEYASILAWQEETGIQVLYPLVADNEYNMDSTDANFWYKSVKGTPVSVDASGNVTKLKYSEDLVLEDNYKRDSDGNLIYYEYAGGGTTDTALYKVRVLYYNYYQYLYGAEPDYIFGTDSMGYDLALRLAGGVRLSLGLAIAIAVINFVIGAFYGSIEGYYGGAADLIMERVSDIIYEMPFVVVATLFQIHLANVVGVVPSMLFAFISQGWIGTASLVRTQFYRFKNQEYVMAARTLGASDMRVIWKHIFPNTLGTIVTSSALVIPGIILSESTISYLGIVKLSSTSFTSLGSLLADASAIWINYPHLMLFPAGTISLLMICFNLFGNGLRDAFNPSLRGSED